MKNNSITWHGSKRVLIRKLRLPGSMEKRRKSQHVLDLGRSFARTGGQPAEPIIVEHMTWKLIAGGDRIAACMNEGIAEVEARMVSGPPEALEALQLIENVNRRNGGEERDAGIRRLLELAGTPEGDSEAFPDVPDEPEERDAQLSNKLLPKGAVGTGKRGRPSTGKARAIDEVAGITGKTSAAVKQADHRAKKKAEKAAAPEGPAKPVPVIESMGLIIPEDISRQTEIQKRVLAAIAGKLTTLQGDLTRAEGELGHQLQGLKEALHSAAFRARQDQPASVCIWCKLVPNVRERCHSCGGRGWLTVGEMKVVGHTSAQGLSLYEQLLATGDKMGIWHGGKFLTMEEAATELADSPGNVEAAREGFARQSPERREIPGSEGNCRAVRAR